MAVSVPGALMVAFAVLYCVAAPQESEEKSLVATGREI
jgi:hypothetical protein